MLSGNRGPEPHWLTPAAHLPSQGVPGPDSGKSSEGGGQRELQGLQLAGPKSQQSPQKSEAAANSPTAQEEKRSAPGLAGKR